MGFDVLVPMHLGQLHAFEAALLALLAFGPFVVLAAVVVVMRRRDGEDEHREGEHREGEAGRTSPTGGERVSDEP